MKIKEKICPACNIIKPLSEFSKRSDAYSKMGVTSHCKKCKRKKTEEWLRTKNGIISKMYSDQKKNSKKRGHGLPSYSLEELRDWCFSQKIFHELYDEWKTSGYCTILKPSCDRTDDYKGYALSRLRITTWEENNKKAYHDRRSGINNKNNKFIVGINKATGEKIEFYSQREAARKTGIHQSSISACCLEKIKSAGGYHWEYKKPMKSDFDGRKINAALFDEAGCTPVSKVIERWQVNKEALKLNDDGR